MGKLIIVLWLLLPLQSLAQTEADIRKHYNDVNKRIQESVEQGFEGPLYQNQLITNKNQKSWPATGRYADTVNFWYDDPPDHLSAADRNPKNVLLKVTVSRTAADYHISEEYLFKDGKLLFYFSFESEEGKYWETRAWFSNKSILFKSSVKVDGRELSAKELASGEYSDSKPSAVKLLSNAKKYQDLFLKSM